MPPRPPGWYAQCVNGDEGDEPVDEDVEPQPELCDLCGTVVSDRSEWYALVPDSSSIHAADAKFDGKRMVVGCTKEHLAELIGQYKRRPFVDAELWAGKIARALQKYEGRINEEDLAEETGLTPDQIEAGVMWQNIEFLRWRQHVDEDGPEPSP